MDAKKTTSVKPKSNQTNWILIAVVALVTFGAYYNSLGNSFVYDDNPFVINNDAIRNLGSIPHMLFSREAYSAGGRFNIYRPLATISFALDYHFWKLNPFGYHLTNALFHVFNAILLFILINLMFDSAPMAFFGSLFFAVHPVQTEAVSWIAGRGNVMFMFFFLVLFFLKPIFYLAEINRNTIIFWLS
jgi:hypothetical protein